MSRKKSNYSNWSESEKDAFLRANRIYAKYKFSKSTLSKQPYLILIFGFVVFALSSEKVNQNEVFSYFTLIQGVALIPLYMLVKRTEKYEHMMYALLAYALIWLIEMVFFGFPNELLAAYNTVKVGGGSMKPHIEFLYRKENENRDVYPLFPFIYSGVKLFFGVIVFMIFRNYSRWEKLPEDTRKMLIS